ncbi:MAG: hypothetical protein ABFD82_05150 [Syntrophaceae bacterium]
MSRDIGKIQDTIKRFIVLKNEYSELDNQLQHIKHRISDIEAEMSEIRNYLYRDRASDFIQDVAVILDKMIKKDKKGQYTEALHELKEIIELWKKDYHHYIRYGIDDLDVFKTKD